MPRNNNHTGSKWFVCGICGFDYPVEYRVRQRGVDVCTYLPCQDRPGGQSDHEDPRTVTFTEVLDEDEVYP